MNKCCRCGHKGPDKDFLVVKGCISLSCNNCLNKLFHPVNKNRNQRTGMLAAKRANQAKHAKL